MENENGSGDESRGELMDTIHSGIHDCNVSYTLVQMYINHNTIP